MANFEASYFSKHKPLICYKSITNLTLLSKYGHKMEFEVEQPSSFGNLSKSTSLDELLKKFKLVVISLMSSGGSSFTIGSLHWRPPLLRSLCCPSSILKKKRTRSFHEKFCSYFIKIYYSCQKRILCCCCCFFLVVGWL